MYPTWNKKQLLINVSAETYRYIKDITNGYNINKKLTYLTAKFFENNAYSSVLVVDEIFQKLYSEIEDE